MFGTNRCGLRSITGNHVLCTCTMMRCPLRKVWFTSGISKARESGRLGTNGIGLDHERLSFYHNGIERRLTDVHGHVLKDVLAS